MSLTPKQREGSCERPEKNRSFTESLLPTQDDSQIKHNGAGSLPSQLRHAGLQDAARDQLLKWKLKPMAANDVPVQAEAALTFRYEITLATDAPQLAEQTSSGSRVSDAAPPAVDYSFIRRQQPL